MRFPRPLGELLHDGLAAVGLGERLRELEIWRIWPDVVGPVVAGRAQPVRIINGTLTVAVSGGPWMQELSFLKGMMKEKLNSRLGGEVVREIVLRSGRVDVASDSTTEPEPPRRALTSHELEYIERQASAIADRETREAFAALMRASLESRPTLRNDRRTDE